MVISEILSNALFYFIGLLIVVTALLTVFSRNLVHSALYMIVTFIGVACIYVMLQADFLAIVQIMVYVGAISILLVFGVMLTRRENMGDSNQFNRYGLTAFIVAVFFFIIVTRLVLTSKWNVTASEPVQSTAGQIADLLFGVNIVPFEIAGVLLLVAMAGAIILGKGADDSK